MGVGGWGGAPTAAWWGLAGVFRDVNYQHQWFWGRKNTVRNEPKIIFPVWGFGGVFRDVNYEHQRFWGQGCEFLGL